MITKNLVNETINLLLNEDKRKELSENILKMAIKDADKRIAEITLRVVETRHATSLQKPRRLQNKLWIKN